MEWGYGIAIWHMHHTRAMCHMRLTIAKQEGGKAGRET